MPQFMSADWAAECQRVLNGWPDEERKASKLQDFWDWINMIRPFVTGRLALSVRDLPPGGAGDTLVLDLEGGTATGASVRERGAAEADAVFLLAGILAGAWLVTDTRPALGVAAFLSVFTLPDYVSNTAVFPQDFYNTSSSSHALPSACRL